ncbi:MAG: hypothetical protein KDK08_05450 [Rhizobiaceae bacterium]|nr:hypothetical protein [Rhizobiaceae bacterium]MCC0000914.1 hypothetical protein [Methylobacteriaceae bacterium]
MKEAVLFSVALVVALVWSIYALSVKIDGYNECRANHGVMRCLIVIGR